MDDKLSQKWAKLPAKGVIDKTAAALTQHGFTVVQVDDSDQSLDKLKELIPDGSDVMTASSTTLSQIGFMACYLDGENPWHCIGPEVYNEEDPEVQATLRRKSDTADYFLGSVNALTESGELIACDGSGSRVSAYLFAAKNVILVVGAQKITRNVQDAMQRVREYVLPLEDERAMQVYGRHAVLAKWIIIAQEINPGRITVILVNQALGF
ncbi:MAG TPA: lactate utilization protein [Candidatus Lokiarchaeia archaeon]|nr:lactate utilization protein [Candidatus Lokiarchaeia archaeon]